MNFPMRKKRRFIRNTVFIRYMNRVVNIQRLRRLLRSVHIDNCIPFKPQLANRNEFISLCLCRLNKRGQVLLYFISIVVAEYYAAGVKLGYDRIQYGLGAAFFPPIDSVHRGSGLADLE